MVFRNYSLEQMNNNTIFILTHSRKKWGWNKWNPFSR